MNGGKPGHRAAECWQLKNDAAQRSCFNCGRPGHQFVQGPELKSKATNFAAEGEKLSFVLSMEHGYPAATHNSYLQR